MNRIPILLLLLVLTAMLSVAAAPGLLLTKEFVGPLPGWMNVKTDFGAVGDGKADDTAALQKTLDALAKGGANTRCVLYLPAGSYRTTATLVFENRLEVAVFGEDPARTRVLYDGPAGESILRCNGVS